MPTSTASAAPRRPLPLSRATLSDVPGHVRVFSYDRKAVTPGIVHIGVGNFHRAHQALYVDRCLHLPGHENWGIVGIGLGIGQEANEKSPRSRRSGRPDTLTEFAPDGSTSSCVIGAIIGDPELNAWIEVNVSFPNSMVDRIAPKVGADTVSLIQELTEIDDRTPVIGETFTQWVVEDKFAAGRPAFEKVGVELRNDVELFEAVKGRLLNASHMMLSYPALMCGYRIVHEAMRDRAIRAYLDTFLERDAMPLVEGPKGLSLNAYKQQILERFSNPAIGDQLERIANNGMAKLPVFLTRTLSMLLERRGLLERIALAFACFEQYLIGKDMKGGSILVSEPHLTAEDHSILDSGDPLAVLRLSMFKTLALADQGHLVDAFIRVRTMLHCNGPLAALDQVARA